MDPFIVYNYLLTIIIIIKIKKNTFRDAQITIKCLHKYLKIITIIR